MDRQREQQQRGQPQQAGFRHGQQDVWLPVRPGIPEDGLGVAVIVHGHRRAQAIFVRQRWQRRRRARPDRRRHQEEETPATETTITVVHQHHGLQPAARRLNDRRQHRVPAPDWQPVRFVQWV